MERIGLYTTILMSVDERRQKFSLSPGPPSKFRVCVCVLKWGGGVENGISFVSKGAEYRAVFTAIRKTSRRVTNCTSLLVCILLQTLQLTQPLADNSTILDSYVEYAVR